MAKPLVQGYSVNLTAGGPTCFSSGFEADLRPGDSGILCVIWRPIKRDFPESIWDEGV